MKKTYFFIFMLSAHLAMLEAAPPAIQDQTDQTDVYAIPLDSSESEENQEEKDLEKRTKKEKPSSQKP